MQNLVFSVMPLKRLKKPSLRDIWCLSVQKFACIPVCAIYMPFQHIYFTLIRPGGVAGQTVDVHREPEPVVDVEGEVVLSLAPMDSARGVGEGCP